jgi:hypothetical protein
LSALDVSKAFDRLNHFSLLQCLIERGFPVQIVNVFCSWFRNMRSCVKWSNDKSQMFSVMSGCPEGSILGPKFFNLVMDKLLLCLHDSKLGCYVGQCFAGAFAYADDIILLSGSVMGLQLMLNICYNFGICCDLLFNVDKCFCGLVGRLVGNVFPVFNLGGRVVPVTDSLVYLGVTFKLGVSLTVDFSQRCRKFMGSVCGVLRHKFAGYEDVFAEILIKKCLPVLNYGLDCVHLDLNSFNVISKCWNTAFRWLYNLGKFESTRLLFLKHNTMSMRYLLDLKLLCFIRNMLDSPNGLLRQLCRFALCDNTLSMVFRKYKLTIYNCTTNIKQSVLDGFFAYCDLKIVVN